MDDGLMDAKGNSSSLNVQPGEDPDLSQELIVAADVLAGWLQERLMRERNHIGHSEKEILTLNSPNNNVEKRSSESNGGGGLELLRQLQPATNGESIGRLLEGSMLLMTRILCRSDTEKSQCRISMPCKQVNPDFEEQFLTAEEKMLLKTPRDFLPITVIIVVDGDDSGVGKTYESHLRKTSSGASSFSYAIGSPWCEIKEEHGYKQGTVLNILANRRNNNNNKVVILFQRAELSVEEIAHIPNPIRKRRIR